MDELLFHDTTCWFEITDENSDACGEQFFTELEDAGVKEHIKYAKRLFPDTEILCLGMVSQERAEAMGLDTY